ncbi:carboxylesterase/lipase family protein [Sphingomonas sp. MMS24-J13]|uniref:carboxylesterase/lipase family protein n=1 Tax=Sphingomonas sp. MMS24-J13 TaxID=3238686 RepID=UPI00385155A0
MKSLAALPLMAAALIATTAKAQIQQARVTGGMIAGTTVDGLSVFKGIPFAAPPVGKLRWAAPQPVRSWPGVRQTVAFGPGCMQNSAMAKQMGADVPLSEDCLFIDVWTAAKKANEKLPVVAWIYGGGFNGGMTSVPLYDGANLARKGVVFVSISYRVGPFGFLATRDLSKESGHGSGNYGLLDQIAGLKWVQDNIAAFGGNPAKVTILGHSAGAYAVSMLAASPLASGLFRSVIAESGANFTPPQDAPWAGTNFQTLGMAETAGQAWLASLGAPTLEQARALPAQRLEEAQRAPGAPRFWPPLDGYVLAGDQYRLWRQHRFNDVPVLVGSNSDEAASFGAKPILPAAFETEVREGYGQKSDLILAAYPHASEAEATRASKQLRRDTAFGWPAYSWAGLQSTNGRAKAYVYYFDRPSERNPDGSGHGQELGLVFGNIGLPGRAPAAPGDREISQVMQGYWINFVTRGDPNGAGLAPWPAFTAADPRVMRIGVDPGAAPIPNLDKLKALDTYYAWRRDGSR